MYRELEIKTADGTMVSMPFKANGATPIRLKQVFQKDFWKIMADAQDSESMIFENMDIISELAYVMHCQGAGKDMGKINFDTYVEWLEGLDGMAILDKASEIINLYVDTSRTGSTAKKPTAQLPGA